MPTGPSSAASFAEKLLEDDFIELEVHKIQELIRQEQTKRDKDVDEYLLLALRADKQQRIRLKAHFKKKKTKSTQQIHMLQQKSDDHHKTLRELEARGDEQVCDQHRLRKPQIEVIRGVGVGLKTAVVIAKPKELAHLIYNPFGSDADNSISNSAPVEIVTTESIPNMMRLSAENSNSFSGHESQSAVVSTPSSKGSSGAMYTSEDGSQCDSSMMTSKSTPKGFQSTPNNYHSGLAPLFQEIQERREECDRLRQEMKNVTLDLLQEVSVVSTALEEEQSRVEQLREQIIDLSELHQNENRTLKENIVNLEEKIQYQSEERLRDIYDSLDGFQARISEVESQAQNYVTLEGIENSNARTVLVKLLNLALMVLVFVVTASTTIAPCFKTRLRVVTTCVLALLLTFVLFWIWGHV